MSRVFILGAGSSYYAGFPLGKELWDFLVDHCDGVDLNSMGVISDYLSTLSSLERDDALQNFEGLLTDFRDKKIPSRFFQGGYMAGDQSWDLGEQEATRLSMRHTLQNDPDF